MMYSIYQTNSYGCNSSNRMCSRENSSSCVTTRVVPCTSQGRRRYPSPSTRPPIITQKTWIRELVYVQHVVYIRYIKIMMLWVFPNKFSHQVLIILHFEHPLVVPDEFNIQLSIMTWCNRMLRVLEMSLLVRQRQLASVLTEQFTDKDIKNI